MEFKGQEKLINGNFCHP